MLILLNLENIYKVQEMETLFAIIILLICVLIYVAIYYAHKYHIVQEENEVLRKLVFREENEEIYR